ncbi:MAG: GNAT family acetyltransferase [Roseiarcus sp.]
MSGLSASSAATIEIGELSEAETEAAVALWRECGLIRPWNDPRADIRLALAGPSSTVIAARVEARLAATVMVGWDGHRGWIYYLAVALGLRRRGIGARMVKAAEDWLARRDAPKLNLLVRAENEAVLAFYESLGYRRNDSILMQRALR